MHYQQKSVYIKTKIANFLLSACMDMNLEIDLTISTILRKEGMVQVLFTYKNCDELLVQWLEQKAMSEYNQENGIEEDNDFEDDDTH